MILQFSFFAKIFKNRKFVLKISKKSELQSRLGGAVDQNKKLQIAASQKPWSSLVLHIKPPTNSPLFGKIFPMKPFKFPEIETKYVEWP